MCDFEPSFSGYVGFDSSRAVCQAFPARSALLRGGSLHNQFEIIRPMGYDCQWGDRLFVEKSRLSGRSACAGAGPWTSYGKRYAAVDPDIARRSIHIFHATDIRRLDVCIADFRQFALYWLAGQEVGGCLAIQRGEFLPLAKGGQGGWTD